MNPSYESIFNNINHFGGVLTPNGTLLTANDAILEFTETEREAVVGENLWDAPGIRSSDSTRRQVRADVRRAAEGECVRHELAVQGPEGSVLIDFSLQPLTDESGDVTHLLAEGHDTTALNHREPIVSETSHGQSDTDALVTYTRDTDEPMSQAILRTFCALNVDIFQKDDTLEEQIDSVALNGFDWRPDCPHRITTRLWGYRVVVSSEEVRIYSDSPDGAAFTA